MDKRLKIPSEELLLDLMGSKLQSMMIIDDTDDDFCYGYNLAVQELLTWVEGKKKNA